MSSIFVILKFKHTLLKFTVYGRKQASMHTHVRNAVPLTQAHPKNSTIHISILSAEFGALVPFYMFLYFWILDVDCQFEILHWFWLDFEMSMFEY